MLTIKKFILLAKKAQLGFAAEQEIQMFLEKRAIGELKLNMELRTHCRYFLLAAAKNVIAFEISLDQTYNMS